MVVSAHEAVNIFALKLIALKLLLNLVLEIHFIEFFLLNSHVFSDIWYIASEVPALHVHFKTAGVSAILHTFPVEPFEPRVSFYFLNSQVSQSLIRFSVQQTRDEIRDGRGIPDRQLRSFETKRALKYFLLYFFSVFPNERTLISIMGITVPVISS
jgi:hypothetical protein